MMHNVSTIDSGIAAADPVRLERLGRHLAAAGINLGDAEANPLGDGHSNLTYLLRGGEMAMVLRRPPLGTLAASTHDVLREARILSRLQGGVARVPRVLHMCADESVIGAPFYLMEYVPGTVLSDSLPGGWDAATAGRAIAEEFVSALVDVHAIDWAAAGLDEIGRPAGYLGRQLRRFDGLWREGDSSGVPLIGEIHAWLRDRIPESPAATVVHGDYRLGNVLFGAVEPVRLEVILDWEMATLGDPLADVGFLTSLWSAPPGRIDLNPLTRSASFPEADELAAHYARLTGRDIGSLRWYQVLALWKLAVMVQRSQRRALDGLNEDPLLLSGPGGVDELAGRAWDLARSGGKQ